tara:strand:+ start:8304 stop:8732 length:429 start_codon:yes stop_codon:yes gene_type:complete
MGNRVIPPVGRFGGIGDLQKRLRGSQIIYENRDDLARVMLEIASAKITDIVSWENGVSTLKDVKHINEGALNAIKRVKITPTKNGDVIDIEMVDKVRVMQMLAKSSGLLDQEKDADKPAVVSIEMVMPEEKKKGKANDTEND